MNMLYRMLALAAVLLPAALLPATLLPTSVAAQSVGTTTVLAPFAGPNYTPAAGQSAIGFWGTDLGYTIKHNGNLRILFGDTHANDSGSLIGWGADDAQGTISLSTFPNGNAVDAYVAAHPAPAGKASWRGAGPPVTLRTNLFGKTAPMAVYRDGALLEMTYFRAPTGAFSNAIDGAYAIFDRNIQTQCSGGVSPSCAGGLTCDRDMGSCFPFGGAEPVACVLGTSSCLCLPVSGGGMCQDRSSSLYNTTESGRIAAIAMRIEVANADPFIDEVYYSQSWVTNKLINSTVRTVNDFSPTRVGGVGNDYNPANGIAPTAGEKVFIWGRPNFVGANAANMSAKLYFAYVDMPRYAANGRFAWAPKYFTGMNANGTPRFSTLQTDAVPLDLMFPGDPTREKLDIVNQMAVSWVPSLNKWMMLYGGDLPDDVVQFFLGANAPLAVRDPNGAVHARFASQPWGPWSDPVPVFGGGDPAVSPPAAGTQYGASGILFHPACSGPLCAGDASPATGDYGRLYGANIVDAWTTARPNGAVDVYWNVSTWNPYQVVLMRTRVAP